MTIEETKQKKREIAKRFRENHPEKIKKNNLAHYWNNRDERILRQKEYYEQNKQKVREAQKEYYKKNKEQKSEKIKQFRLDNPYFVRQRERAYYFKRHYGITMNELAEMWEVQNGVCGNHKCNRVLVQEKGGFAVDHCHATGKIRGLLCRFCNVSLGNMEDDVNKLLGLIAYLQSHKDGGKNATS